MAGGERIVQLDLSELTRFAEQLRTSAPRIINEAWKALSAWGAEYQRRVQRVTPVDEGHARRGWQLIRDKENLSVTVGNSVKSEDGKPYLVYLEYGTDRIAGGRVKAWTPGQPPIMDWPAKDGELPSLMDLSPGGQKYERHVDVISKAFTPGTGEQMPMLRPIGHEIAPLIVADIAQAVREGFQSLRDKYRRNGGGTP